MTSDEALDLLDRCYHSPAVNVVRAEVERLRQDLAAAQKERDSLRQHLHDEHQRHVGTMDERDAIRSTADEYAADVCRALRECGAPDLTADEAIRSIAQQRDSWRRVSETLAEEMKAAGHDIARHVEIAATQAQELEELRTRLADAEALAIRRGDIQVRLQDDLAAARALLKDARAAVSQIDDYRIDALVRRIDAALAAALREKK